MNIILLCSLICLSSSSVLNQLAPMKKITNKSLISIDPLKKMVNKQLVDVIMDHQEDPAYLLSVLANVDPTQLNAVIVLIQALLAASESDLAALTLASTNANTAYTDATVAYDAAVLARGTLETAYTDASVLAEKHYTDAKTQRETAYTAESGVLDQKVNALFVVQTEANGAKKNAQDTLDTESLRLQGEIATLKQVIALLEGLGGSSSGLSSCFDASATGSYTIGGNNVYCDTSDGGGWALAMQFSGASSFTFRSSYWTDQNLLGTAGEAPTGGADGKYDAFNNVEVQQIRVCFVNCVTLEVPSAYIGQTLYSLFTSVAEDATGLEFSTTASEFGAAMGISNNGMCWQHVKLNFNDNLSDYTCMGRLALIRNNECGPATANDALGFGVQEASGGGTGSGQTVYSGNVSPMSGQLWVRGIN